MEEEVIEEEVIKGTVAADKVIGVEVIEVEVIEKKLVIVEGAIEDEWPFEQGEWDKKGTVSIESVRLGES